MKQSEDYYSAVFKTYMSSLKTAEKQSALLKARFAFLRFIDSLVPPLTSLSLSLYDVAFAYLFLSS